MSDYTPSVNAAIAALCKTTGWQYQVTHTHLMMGLFDGRYWEQFYLDLNELNRLTPEEARELAETEIAIHRVLLSTR